MGTAEQGARSTTTIAATGATKRKAWLPRACETRPSPPPPFSRPTGIPRPQSLSHSRQMLCARQTPPPSSTLAPVGPPPAFMRPVPLLHSPRARSPPPSAAPSRAYPLRCSLRESGRARPPPMIRKTFPALPPLLPSSRSNRHRSPTRPRTPESETVRDAPRAPTEPRPCARAWPRDRACGGKRRSAAGGWQAPTRGRHRARRHAASADPCRPRTREGTPSDLPAELRCHRPRSEQQRTAGSSRDAPRADAHECRLGGRSRKRLAARPPRGECVFPRSLALRAPRASARDAEQEKGGEGSRAGGACARSRAPAGRMRLRSASRTSQGIAPRREPLERHLQSVCAELRRAAERRDVNCPLGELRLAARAFCLRALDRRVAPSSLRAGRRKASELSRRSLERSVEQSPGRSVRAQSRTRFDCDEAASGRARRAPFRPPCAVGTPIVPGLFLCEAVQGRSGVVSSSERISLSGRGALPSDPSAAATLWSSAFASRLLDRLVFLSHSFRPLPVVRDGQAREEEERRGGRGL